MGMHPYVRVKAEPAVDNPGNPPLHFDVVLNEQDQIAGDLSFFGMEGEIDRPGGHALPFVVYEDGKVDYGDVYPTPEERYAHVDLRDGKVQRDRLPASSRIRLRRQIPD